MIQIKVLTTVYTPQDLEAAARCGAEGFTEVAELDDDMESFAFSKELLDDAVIEKTKEIVKEGFTPGDTFYVGEDKYELLNA